jgi:hypothetical protein
MASEIVFGLFVVLLLMVLEVILLYILFIMAIAVDEEEVVAEGLGTD